MKLILKDNYYTTIFDVINTSYYGCWYFVASCYYTPLKLNVAEYCNRFLMLVKELLFKLYTYFNFEWISAKIRTKIVKNTVLIWGKQSKKIEDNRFFGINFNFLIFGDQWHRNDALKYHISEHFQINETILKLWENVAFNYEQHYGCAGIYCFLVKTAVRWYIPLQSFKNY